MRELKLMNPLSQATTKRMMQLGFCMYDDTRFSTRAISPSLPPSATLAIKPVVEAIVRKY